MKASFSGAPAPAATAWEIRPYEGMEADLHAALADRELLLTELTHRVRNTLQLVGSLLSLQARQIENPDVRRALGEAYQRVLAIAGVYMGLDRGHIGYVEFGRYLRSVAQQLLQNIVHGDGRIALTVDTDRGMLDLDHAVPLGLIANELITAALKCSAAEDTAAEITVFFGRDTAGNYRLSVTVLFPEIQESRPLSGCFAELDLVRTLVQQVDGVFTVDQTAALEMAVSFRARSQVSGTPSAHS